ncbi:regulator of (H+)-ATPase in vacuolar membrane [Entomophthora muscae]|uniref:Regulator of (H+)-ATPase in vacuolar membrane n=1 Tax=Entomophthora muscae TaxID=34485 RepID=A0ACC2U2J2_9FUNG|nr:regulator of (H+)-ATPase in vacuolar membrane [Entomophthora muscae]
MFPFQLCTGKVNPFPRALHFSYLGPNLLLIYGCANRLIISSWRGQLIQYIVLEQEQDIRSVSLSPISGKIAISCHKSIQLFTLKTPASEKDLQWTHEASFELDAIISGVSWFDGDKLLISGSGLSIWELANGRWASIWSERSSSELYLAESSPDFQLVGITHKYDRLVKIWSPGLAGNNRTRQFGYIKHPRAVTNIGWHKRKNDGPSILFTSCLDGVFRAWAPTNPNSPCQFYLCASVEPSPWVTEMDDKNTISHCAPLHWIDSTVISELAHEEILRREKHQRSSSEEARQSMYDSELICLQELIENPLTLLFQVQADGALVAWKLEGLNRFPYTTPKVYNVARIPAAVRPCDEPSFFGACFVTSSPASMQLKDSRYPMEFSILVQNQDLEMDHYTLNFSQVLLAKNGGSELSSQTTWTGHRSQILQMVSSTTSRLQEPCFATRTTNEIGFWRALNHPGSSQPLNQTHMAFHEDRITDMAWVTSGCLAVADSNFCHVYYTQEGGACRRHSLDCPYEISHIDKLVVAPATGNDTFHILAECLATQECFEWEIVISDPVSINASFKQRIKIPECSGLYGWRLDPLARDNPLSIASFTKDGRQLNVSGLESGSWRNVGAFELSMSNPDTLICGPEGSILLASLESRLEKQFFIIDTRLAEFGIIQEYSLEFRIKDIKAIRWLPSFTGRALLGIATTDSVHILCQNGPTWTCIGKATLPEWIEGATRRPSHIDDFVFSPDGTVAACVNGLVVCLGKWLASEDPAFEQASTNTLLALNDALRPRIPHHHPEFLIELFRWGDVDGISRLLVHMEDSITHQDILCDSVTLIIPPLPFENFFPEASQEKEAASGLESLFTLGNDARRELSEYQINSLCDALKSYAVEDLVLEERLRLVSIIKMFFTAKPLRSSADGLGFQFILDAYLAYAGSPENVALPSSSLLAAFHSTMQDILLTSCLTLYNRHVPDAPMLWPTLKSFGIVYWIRDDSILRREAETLARNQYLKEKDPVECSLIYLALDKKRLLLSLWKNASYHSDHAVMVKFLSNDFSLERWKTAAQKNAFKLIGKQRYEYAAAFFILGGQLKDAVSLCIRYLKDMELALLICRCSEGIYGEVAQNLIKSHLLPDAISRGDRPTISMMLWWISEKSLSISSLSCSLEWLCQQLSPRIDYNSQSPATVSLPVYLRFKHIPINLRQDTAPQNVEDEGNIFLRTATSYETQGLTTLALYALKKWDIALEDNAASCMDWEWGASNHKRPSQQQDPAIHSGQINFDDWSWGSTTTTRTVGQTLFDSTPKSKQVATLGMQSALSSRKLQMVQNYQRCLLLRMGQEVVDSLRVSKVPGLLPKALIYSYLDGVKSSIQHVCRMVEVEEVAFDKSLVQWCCEKNVPLLGFELIFQGILSQELTGQWLMDALFSECDLLVSICFDKEINAYYHSNTFRDWIHVAIRDYPRWSVALRLNGQASVTTSQLQSTMTVLLTVYLFVLVKERNYVKLLSLLKQWQSLNASIKNDLHQLEPLLEQILKDHREVHTFDADLDAPWDLDFDIGNDLQIKYKDADTSQAPLENNCESIFQETELFCDIFSFVIEELEQLILDYNPNAEVSPKLASLSYTLLAPLLLLHQELTSLRETLLERPEEKSFALPPLLQVPPDVGHDTFLLASYFSQIRLFLKDQGFHPK